MATLTDSNFPNLTNILKRTDPSGKFLSVAEMLDQELDFLEDIPWVQCNTPTGHLLSQRTALPSSSNLWRGYNQGSVALKSDSTTFTEVTGMMEGRTVVDEKLLKHVGNANEFRNSEAKAVIETFSQEFAQSLWYSSVLTAPKQIHGLSPRYPATTGYTSSSYVRALGQDSDPNASNCHSIWLITWDPEYVFGIYPQGSMAGITREDKGLVTITDPNDSSRRLDVYEEKFAWEGGIAVKDYRYAMRLQWDPDGVADSAKTLYLALDEMFGAIKALKPSTRLYMNRTSRAKLIAQLGNNAHSSLEWMQLNGRPIEGYRGIPIRVTDSLVAEAEIS